MKLEQEIRRFARHYGMSVSDARKLFAEYGRKPQHYRRVVEISADAKTVKGEKYGYLTGIVYFAQADLSGYEVCPKRNALCTAACLGNEGRASVYKSITLARIAKTKRYFEDRANFLASLKHDAFRLMRKAAKRKLVPCLRPNGTSDLPVMAYEIVKTFPQLQVYDYTKNPKPWLRIRPNYHLTFSRSGTNDTECLQALEHGVNVSAVFARGVSMPSTLWGYPVINGDQHDLRFLDPKGVIVGLTSKGQSAKKEISGQFIILQ